MIMGQAHLITLATHIPAMVKPAKRLMWSSLSKSDTKPNGTYLKPNPLRNISVPISCSMPPLGKTKQKRVSDTASHFSRQGYATNGATLHSVLPFLLIY